MCSESHIPFLPPSASAGLCSGNYIQDQGFYPGQEDPGRTGRKSPAPTGEQKPLGRGTGATWRHSSAKAAPHETETGFVFWFWVFSSTLSPMSPLATPSPPPRGTTGSPLGTPSYPFSFSVPLCARGHRGRDCGIGGGAAELGNQEESRLDPPASLTRSQMSLGLQPQDWPTTNRPEEGRGGSRTSRRLAAGVSLAPSRHPRRRGHFRGRDGT